MSKAISLGLKVNIRQFTLFLIINAFVGSMVGLERTILPLLAEEDFGMASKSAMLSFIAVFGLVKAISNYFAGRFSDHWGRKKVLVIGWLFAIPVPLLIILAPNWSWIIVANILLGINQGLAWSTLVVMKIDLVGPARRGLAMGLNEAFGYIAVAVTAWWSGILADQYNLRPEPFYLGIAFSIVGLLLSVFFARETKPYALLESATMRVAGEETTLPSAKEIFLLTSWKNRTLFNISQAGLINNMNDGLRWGLLPLVFASAGLSMHQIALLAMIFPAFWGVGQLFTGYLSDRWGRKPFVVWGMLLQGAALVSMIYFPTYEWWMISGALTGIGTAMIYPTLIAAIGDVTGPSWRASAVGVYRLWRDGGYVVGALISGVIADALGYNWAIGVIGLMSLLSGILIAIQMKETLIKTRSQPASNELKI